jgi:DNA-directed RNA polymerase specialized sigma24 family protein
MERFMDDDAKLLQLYARERSEKAFAELVQRHLPAVYAVTPRRVGGDVHLAEEATQDVFTALSRKAASLTSTPSIAGWLFVSARFASAKIVRRGTVMILP